MSHRARPSWPLLVLTAVTLIAGVVNLTATEPLRLSWPAEQRARLRPESVVISPGVAHALGAALVALGALLLWQTVRDARRR